MQALPEPFAGELPVEVQAGHGAGPHMAGCVAGNFKVPANVTLVHVPPESRVSPPPATPHRQEPKTKAQK